MDRCPRLIEYPVRRLSWTKARAYGLPAVFFVFFFLYLLVYIDPRVIYSCNGFDLYSYVRYTHSQEIFQPGISAPRELPGHHRYILELTSEYLKGIVAVPGGLTRLLVTLAVYACHYPFTGAAAITFFAWLLYFLSRACLRMRGGSVFLWGYLPPVFLLLICGWYDLNCMAYFVPVLGALLACVIYQRQLLRRTAARSIAFTLLFWITYYFFQWACLLFILLAVIHELLNKPKALFALGIAALINMGAAYLIENYLLPPENAFKAKEFFTPAVLPLVITLYFPLVTALCLPCLRNPASSSALAEGIRALALVLVVAGAVLWSVKDPVNNEIRAVARTSHFMQNRQWSSILNENTSAVFKKRPAGDNPLQLFMTHAIDYALCRTGQLGSAMFSYPQSCFSAEPLLMIKNTLLYGFINWASALDVFMDLGMVNYAEKVAGETMENMGPYPFIVYRRALIQTAKGNNKAAAVYCNMLSRMPFFRNKARRLSGMLADSAALAADSGIAHLRACRDTSDYFLYQFFQVNEEKIFLDLLKSNPANKMAYEYLMAYYLQTGQTDKIAEQVRRAPDFGYTQLPRHWEEALCIYLSLDTARISTVRNPPVRLETVRQFNKFLQTYSAYRGDPAQQAAAAAKMEDAFGTTYFYFYTFQGTRGARGHNR